VNQAFSFWLWPLLGVIFLPFTTLMYVLVIGPLGSTNFWGWLTILLGLLIDLRAYADSYAYRKQIPGVPSAYTN
jgi:hypothetical protein